MRLLFIHGRAQGQKDAKALERIWVETLKQGVAKAGKTLPPDLQIDFPFYGDALDTFANEADLPVTTDVLAKGDGGDAELQAFAAEVLLEMYEGSPDTRSDVDKLDPDGAPKEKGAQNWPFVRKIVQAIDNRYPGLSEHGIKLLLRDVFLYVRVPFVRDGIDEIVEAMLTDQPTVIVGHSLGTVVGYNVIRKNIDKMNLVKVISLGSPLGIKAIAATLGTLENRASDGWYNAYDPVDIVALNPLSAPFFVTDPKIENNGKVQNETRDHHGIVGYLGDPDVAGQIADALNRQA